MPEQKWEVVDSVGGDLKAELLRSYLEAQGIPVLLSQEGVGHSIYPVNIGKLGKVDILVPTLFKARALELVQGFYEPADQEDETLLDDETAEDQPE